MTKVFIGGSRAVSRLDDIIREKLDDLIARNCEILVGDANGADKAVQQHYADRGYQHVIVYRMDRCRNNLGSWPTRRVTAPRPASGFAYYAAKDLAMAGDARCGVMLWDGRSKGTLNNIQQLVGAGKPVLAYLSSEKTFYKLSTEVELEQLLDRCDPDSIQDARRQIKTKLSPRVA